MKENSTNKLLEFIQNAFAEDIGSGDHTTAACITSDEKGSAQLKIKEDGVLAGSDVAQLIFNHYDKDLQIETFIEDGAKIKEGQIAFSVFGSVNSILTTERLVLNLMQRMSGIATTTSRYAERIAHTKAKVLDTRKTTPGLRWFEKEAVRIGGGQNHRFGLYDMILIKDNHVDASGGITNALKRAQNYVQTKKLDIEIEIEVRSMKELEEALSTGIADRIMLDNFSVLGTEEAVRFVEGRSKLESSGGITLDTIQGYAEAGVDFISVGALTHSVKSLDLSLKIS